MSVEYMASFCEAFIGIRVLAMVFQSKYVKKKKCY